MLQKKKGNRGKINEETEQADPDAQAQNDGTK